MRVGCDIVDLRIFSESVQKQEFCERVFSVAERAYCDNTMNRVGAYAARFAAKEAFLKALGTGFFSKGMTPAEVWVEKEDSKRPVLGMTEKVRVLLLEMSCESVEVSLSHHGDYAMAVVVLN